MKVTYNIDLRKAIWKTGSKGEKAYRFDFFDVTVWGATVEQIEKRIRAFFIESGAVIE